MNLISELKAALGQGAVFTGGDIPERAKSDASDTGVHRPLALLRPATTAEVSAALAICWRHNQSVVPQGGMTGLSGGANPRPSDVALSLDRLAGIENIDPDTPSMTLRAGTVLQVAQNAAAEEGLLLPIDLGSRGSCQIGGLIANNAGGVRVIRYGMTRANLLGLEVVLADGTIVSNLNKLQKNNTGYDLKQLIVGSEGTLGIITRAVIRLHSLPKVRCTALCALENFNSVIALLKHARAELVDLSALEVMWHDYFSVLEQAEGLKFFPVTPSFAVIVETEGNNQDDQAEKFQAFLERALQAGVLRDALVAKSSTDANEFWAIREGHKLSEVMSDIINFDVSLNISQMDDFVVSCRKALKQHFPGTKAMFFGHVGDGNVHIVVELGDSKDAASTTDVYKIVYDLIHTVGGSISAEHGIGSLKRDYLCYSRSPAEISMMQSIKSSIDQRGILNPGKLL